MINRRRFLGHVGAAGVGAFLGLRSVYAGPTGVGAALSPRPVDDRIAPSFGPLVPDPQRILDLPEGFSHRVIARTGELMDDGLLVPGDQDGMGAFDAGRGRVALVCNHELSEDEIDKGPFGPGADRLHRIDRSRIFDPGRARPSLGGTTTMIYDPRSGRREKIFLSLVGTDRNCAGGPTPWGSWLSCEESTNRADDVRSRDHGWVFEVPADATELVDAVPLTAMGRFNHEAAAVDPASGVVYLTEDRSDSLFYRMIPKERGNLAAGGRLQALVVRDWGNAADTRNWPRAAAGTGADRFPEGESLAVDWIDMDDVEAPDDDLRERGHAAGAALFARGEGIWFGNGEVYFAATSGGTIEAGQIFRYRPSPEEGRPGEKAAPGMLELFVESTDRRLLQKPDNVTVTPWSDVIACEDGGETCALIGITPAGGLYKFAENSYSESELAGACFSPDGRTLFVNIQSRGMTLAIDGPFPTA